MAFSDFKTLLADWIWRSDDSDLDAQVAFISKMAEARLNRELRHRKMITSSNVTFTPPAFPQVPSDFLHARSVTYGESASDAYEQHRFVTINQMDDLEYQTTFSGHWFTIRGTDIVLKPMPDAVASGTQYVTLVYYGKVPVFSTEDSSWVYDDYPDLYLHACLAEASDYIRDDAKIAQYEGKYRQFLEQAIRDSRGQEYSGSRLVMRPRGFKG